MDDEIRSVITRNNWSIAPIGVDPEYIKTRLTTPDPVYDTSAFEIPRDIPETGSFIAWKKAMMYIGPLRTVSPYEMWLSWSKYTRRRKCYVKIVNCLVKLEIPEDAQRLQARYSHKCRADKAKVLAFEMFIDGLPDPEALETIKNTRYEVRSNFRPEFIYKLGETVYPDRFDPNYNDECSHGIHFFLTKQEAIEFRF